MAETPLDEPESSSESRRLLAIGSSHLRALRLAYKAREAQGQTEGLQIQFVQINREEWKPPKVKGRFSDPIRAEIDAAGLCLIVSSFGGNDHNVLGLANHPEKFDFVLPESPDLQLQEDVHYFPYELIRRTLARHLLPTLGFMQLLRESTKLPIVHLESPPPNPSEEFIRANPAGFDEVVPQLGVSPAPLRYKLWRLHSEIIREACAENAIEFVAAPKDMQDADGMLVPEAWYDPSHGNELYGERLYQQVLQIVAKRVPNSV